MKTAFFGFYPPTNDEYKRLWNEGLIVLDTNVLLNLYRLPTVARDELISVLESLKDRLWIPHQVALEFHRKRLTVIAGERKSMEDALSAASALVTDIKKKVDGLQIEKRGLGIQPDNLISELDKANGQLVEAIQKAHSSQLDISASDPVRERLDALLDKRVGTGPNNQAELDELCKDGEDRYQENIPPGFMDADKDKNPKEAAFIFDHIKYQRKYGDLILWRQLIRHGRDAGIKTVLLITADRKEDWWWREQGKTIGPHPELVREIRREGGVELFWMYSSVQFVEHANTYSSAKVSTESVAEIQNVMSSRRLASLAFDEAPRLEKMRRLRELSGGGEYYETRAKHRADEFAVGEWLSQLGYRVQPSDFPDFLVHKGDYVHGYEVKHISAIHRFLESPSAVRALFEGVVRARERRFNTLSLVILVPPEDFIENFEPERISELEMRCLGYLKKYMVHSILMGAVINGKFELLVQAEAREALDDPDFRDD